MQEKPFYKSKKFWMAILSVLLPFVNRKLGLGLDTDELLTAASGPVSYIVGQSYIDSKMEVVRKAGNAAKNAIDLAKRMKE